MYWGPLIGFANPPWCLIGRGLSQVMDQKAQVVLVAPVWKGQPWHPVLLNMEHALGVSSTDSSTLQPGPESSGTGSTEVDPPASRMAYLWEKFSDSRFSEEAADLLLASWRTKSSQSYTHTSENGLAGVLHEVQIPFQDLLIFSDPIVGLFRKLKTV